MGWPTGLEPATARTTIWSSTIELWPPFGEAEDSSRFGLANRILRTSIALAFTQGHALFSNSYASPRNLRRMLCRT